MNLRECSDKGSETERIHRGRRWSRSRISMKYRRGDVNPEEGPVQNMLISTGGIRGAATSLQGRKCIIDKVLESLLSSIPYCVSTDYPGSAMRAAKAEWISAKPTQRRAECRRNNNPNQVNAISQEKPHADKTDLRRNRENLHQVH